MSSGRREDESGLPRSVEDTLSVRLTGGPDAAAVARNHLSRLRGDLDAPLRETMRLLVTELVSNSIKHAQAEYLELRAVVGSGAVWVEVCDQGGGFEPVPRDEGRDDDGGWGLFLVDRLASRWGVSNEDSATRVWFELRRS